MQNDCDDLRFTILDKQTTMPYWIESGCDSTSTMIWIKIPNLAASAGTTLYVYYGNTAAAIASDGDNTFDFFDDFVGTTLNTTKWMDWDPNSYGTMSIAGGTLSIGMTGTGGSSVIKNRGIQSTQTFDFTDNGKLIETYSRWAFAEPGSGDSTAGVLKSINILDNSNPTGICSWSSNVGGNIFKFGYMRYQGIFNINVNQVIRMILY
jgi:hypothetical protein